MAFTRTWLSTRVGSRQQFWPKIIRKLIKIELKFGHFVLLDLFKICFFFYFNCEIN